MKNYREYSYQIRKVGEQNYQFDIHPPIGLSEFDYHGGATHNQADKTAKIYIDQQIALRNGE